MGEGISLAAQTQDLWEKTKAKLCGRYNAYGVQHKRSQLYRYYVNVVRVLLRWLNRQSQKKLFTWKDFQMRIQRYPLLAPPLARHRKPLGGRKRYVY